MALPDRFQPYWQPAPSHPGQVPGMAAPPVYTAPQEAPNFLDTLRKLWRYRGMILIVTAVFAAISVVVAKQIPSTYIAESRVLVGMPSVRALNIEAIINELSPDAERVQNESFVILSRDVARQTIERLGLSENPEFNPFIRTEPAWQRYLGYLNPLRYIPAEWLGDFGEDEKPLTPEEQAEFEMNVMIDVLLDKLDVATLGRSHVLSIQARSLDPNTAAQ